MTSMKENIEIFTGRKEHSWFLKHPEELEVDDPVSPVPVVPSNPFLTLWQEYREYYPLKLKRKQLDNLRDILQYVIDPLNPYKYRDLHYLGYYGTVGLLIPNGFIVNQAETDKAWLGLHADPLFQPKWLKGSPKNAPNKHSLQGLVFYQKDKYGAGQRTYLKDFWFRRYVIIESAYLSYPYVSSNDIVHALIGDLQLLGFRSNIRLSMSKKSLPDFYNSAKATGKNAKNFNFFFNLGWFISELELLIRYSVRNQSAIPYPIMPNFGFEGTVPWQIVYSNWGYIRAILDAYFGLSDYVGPRGRGYGYVREASLLSDSGSSVPVSSSSVPSSTPPTNPRTGGTTGYSNRGYQE